MSILAKSVELKRRDWNEGIMHEVERPYMIAIYEHGSHLRFLCQQLLKHGSDKTKILLSAQNDVADTSRFLRDAATGSGKWFS
jgi:hypothetical protein